MINVSQVTLLELVNRDTPLKRVANTKGGEYAGPCPWCGGDDRFHVWPNDERPHYWCRQCNRHGDAIQYLRDCDGRSYQEARSELKLSADDNRRGQRQRGQRIGGQKLVSQKRNQRKQTQQGGRGASNSQSIPLALGFKPQMRADFLEGDSSETTALVPTP